MDDREDEKRSPAPCRKSDDERQAISPSKLLRFISQDLNLKVLVAQENEDYHLQLIKDGDLLGSRRLAKVKCCQSEPPCMGTVPISAQFQLKYDLPSFVHVSLCYGQISEYFEQQNQRYPRTC